MDVTQAIKHFGSQAALAQALGVSMQVVWNWKHRGKISALHKYRLEQIIAAEKRANAART